MVGVGGHKSGGGKGSGVEGVKDGRGQVVRVTVGGGKEDSWAGAPEDNKRSGLN